MTTKTTIRPRVLGAAVLGLVALWSCAAALALYSALPYNPLSPSESKPLVLTTMLPQGWAFFTRNPREPRLLAYEPSPQGWVRAGAGTNSSAANLGGLARVTRSQAIELGMITGSIPEDAWQPCAGGIAECLEHERPIVAVENASPRPSFCGELALAQQPPIPWAWSARITTNRMPGRIVRLDVHC